VAFGIVALSAADLITGMAAFSLIALGSLWYFCVSYLRISADYQAHGMVVSSGAQIFGAWMGGLVAIPLMAITAYLAVRAYSVPRSIYRMGSLHPTGRSLRGHGPA
jgi:hypothetical protein